MIEPMTSEPAALPDRAHEPTDGTDGVGREDGPESRAPTAAQLRRFIKSRPFVPLHELRRRFELNGELDDVRCVSAADGSRYYVGLPEREAELLAQLVRDGDVGVELSRDPHVPVVVGVYAMRPVTRNG
jgi:hypothetical protein